jgi:hypothetical protein
MVKLISIKPSTKADKKYMATFETDKGRTKTTHFGAKGMGDFIKSGGDEKKKAAYIARHKVNENFNDPTTAGALSRWILWNKPTLSASIADYRRRFNI